MSSTTDSATPSPASSDRLTGRVKWFNNKAGYGFITVTDGSRSGSDIFVHHSTIGVASQQYKYLVQGEYVDFELSSTQGSSHEFQATNVVGIKGGKLMCETRHEYKMSRSSYKSLTDEPKVDVSVKVEEPKTPRQKSAPKTTHDGDKKAWTKVDRRKPASFEKKPARA